MGWGFQDIANLADLDSRLAAASAAGKADREAEIRGFPQGVYVLPTSSPAYEETRETFRELEAARAAILDRANLGTNQIEAARRAVAAREVQLFIVQSEDVIATAYPDTSLLISRNLLDQFSDDAAHALWSRRFTLAHELVHLRDAHPVLNWIALQARSRSGNARVAATLFNVFSDVLSQGGPDLGTIRVYNEGSNYQTLANEAGFFEFLADYWAFYILRELKAPAGVGLAALKDVAARQGVAERPPSGITLAFLPERIDCMARLDVAEPTAATDNAYWSCALRSAKAPTGNSYRDAFMAQKEAAYEREVDKNWDDAPPGGYRMSLFPDDKLRGYWETEWKMREALLLRASGSARDTLAGSVIDGIPIKAAGDGFRSTRALPDLVIEQVRVSTSPMAFTQEQAALVQVRVKNVGRRPVTAPYALAIAPRPGLEAPCPMPGLCNPNTAPPWDIGVADTFDLRLYAPAEALALAQASPDWGVTVIHCAAGEADCDRPEQDVTNNWLSLTPPPPPPPPPPRAPGITQPAPTPEPAPTPAPSTPPGG